MAHPKRKVKKSSRANAARRRPAKTKSHHRPPTKPNRARPRKKKSQAKHKHRNPGEIIGLTLGNSGRRRNVAQAKKKRKSSTRRPNAGRPHKPKMTARRGRRNPAGFSLTDVVYLGAGAVIAPPISAAASQMILGAGNTGFMSYLVNLAATGLLAFVGHKFVKRPAFAAGILAGGVGSVIRKAITDMTPYGSFLGQSGVGDYMVSHWLSPQRLPDALHSAEVENPGGPWAMPAMVMQSSGAGGGGGMGYFDGSLY
jgi:hypothetical protein